MTITQFSQQHLEDVQKLYKLCNPGVIARPHYWYFANPTLVVTKGDLVVGFTSFTLTLIPGFGQTLYGQDVCVHPEFRGRHLATRLHAARLNLGYIVGARVFMGSTHCDNSAMRQILEKAGAHACLPLGENIMYVSPIRGG